MRNVKPREVEQLVQHHTAGEWQSWDLNLGLADSKQAVIEEEHLPGLGVESGGLLGGGVLKDEQEKAS